MSRQKVISFGLQKFIERYTSAFGRRPPRELTKKIRGQFRDGAASREENRLIHGLSSSGRVEYFALSNVVPVREYGRNFLIFPMMYCVPDRKIRRRFYRAIRARAKEFSGRKDVQDLAVWCHFDDSPSKKYFQARGALNMVEFVGDVGKTLGALKVEFPYKTRKLRPTDLRIVSRIELLSHRGDSSSRMHQAMGRKGSLKGIVNFHRQLLKRAYAFVALDGEKIRGLGAIFPDKQNNVANIATISVHPRYAGRGIAKSLYREMLLSLKKAGIRKYVGHSSTKAVLAMAEKMKRVELSRTYTTSLEKFVSGR